MFAFIFPSNPLNSKLADDDYLSEYESLKQKGWPVYLIDVDALEPWSTSLPRSWPDLELGHELIYRGWMLREEKYLALDKAVLGQLKIKTQNYLNSHHIPNWIESVKDFSAETAYTSEINSAYLFNDLGWGRAFIKDYVKSLKTGQGSIVQSSEDVLRAIKDMKQYKGFIEGGIVFREVLDLKPDTEVRFFALNNKLYCPSYKSLSEHFVLDEKEWETIKRMAFEVLVRHQEFFYSIDIAMDKTGKAYLIEIGDAQVSSWTGWQEKEFVDMLDNLKSLSLCPHKIKL